MPTWTWPKDATGSNDVRLAERMRARAMAFGVGQSELKSIDRHIEQRKRRPKTIDEEARDELLRSEAELACSYGDLLVRLLVANPDRDRLGDTLLYAVLAVEPDNAVARDRVRSRLPAAGVPPEPFETADWLDFVEATARNPIETLVPLKELPKANIDSTILERRLANTAGFYDTEEHISRVFLPDEDEGGFASVMQTYAHELTHHWIDTQMRLFQTRARQRAGPGMPGFWIVEGFASLVESFSFDVRDGRWSTEPSQYRAMDLVANAQPGQLIPWEELLTMPQATFMHPPYKGESEISRSTVLGVREPLTPVGLLYAQAEVVTRLLFEDATLRPRLLDYCVAYTTADADGVGIEKAFGFDGAELGRRAEALARATMDELWMGTGPMESPLTAPELPGD